MGMLKKKKKEEEAPAAEVSLNVTNQAAPVQKVSPKKEEEPKAGTPQFGHQSRDFKRPLNGI
jgi:hypothetical protein